MENQLDVQELVLALGTKELELIHLRGLVKKLNDQVNAKTADEQVK
jgi:hypothetical protein